MKKQVNIIVLVILVAGFSLFFVRRCNKSMITTTVVKEIKPENSDHVYYYLPKTIFEIQYSLSQKRETIEVKQYFVTDFSKIFDIHIQNYTASTNSNGYTIIFNDNAALKEIELNSVSNTADNIKFAVNAGTSIIKIIGGLNKVQSQANRTTNQIEKDTIYKFYFEPKNINEGYKNGKVRISFINTDSIKTKAPKSDSAYQGIISRLPLSILMQIKANTIDTAINVKVPQLGVYQYHYIPISATKDVKTKLVFKPDGTLESKSITHSNKLSTKITQGDLDEMVRRINEALDTIKK